MRRNRLMENRIRGLVHEAVKNVIRETEEGWLDSDAIKYAREVMGDDYDPRFNYRNDNYSITHHPDGKLSFDYPEDFEEWGQSDEFIPGDNEYSWSLHDDDYDDWAKAHTLWGWGLEHGEGDTGERDYNDDYFAKDSDYRNTHDEWETYPDDKRAEFFDVWDRARDEIGM